MPLLKDIPSGMRLHFQILRPSQRGNDVPIARNLAHPGRRRLGGGLPLPRNVHARARGPGLLRSIWQNQNQNNFAEFSTFFRLAKNGRRIRKKIRFPGPNVIASPLGTSREFCVFVGFGYLAPPPPFPRQSRPGFRHRPFLLLPTPDIKNIDARCGRGSSLVFPFHRAIPWPRPSTHCHFVA